ncbi:hypothetical protein Tco_1219607 [Tanacetum coccineum]
MATLKFADSHNMVAFLSKPTESEGFEKIVDFLNAHPIRGLSLLKHLLEELLELRHYDECLSPKTTAWNEFSSTMASAIICLATNQKHGYAISSLMDTAYWSSEQ